MTVTRSHIILLALLACGIVVWALYGVLNPHPPIKIGFSGPLEGKFSDLGMQGRNGVQLCVEHINAAGGINGRKLALETRNDGQTEAEAVAADSALMEAGVVAIIGHMTSQQSIAAITVHGNKGMVYISPTTSAPALTGIRDNFFRVMSQNTSWAWALAEHVVQHRNLHRFAAIYDLDNESYTRSYTKAFAERVHQLGGMVQPEIPVHASRQKDWLPILRDARMKGIDGIFIALSSRDTVALAQTMDLNSRRLPLFSAPWAFTNELVMTGGRHVEGLTAAISFNPDNQRPEYQRFKAAYIARFGWPPSFAAAYGYEAMQTLGAALSITKGSRQGLARAMTRTGLQTGVSGPFELDAYGDIKRPTFILTVHNGTVVNAQ